MEKDFKQDIHILCVEDDDINQTVLKMLLQKLGYKKISLAANSMDAVALLEKPDTAVNIILMDLGLPTPGMNGIALTQQIRQSNWNAKNVPIIALTGNEAVIARGESNAAGMNGFLSKPVDLEKLRIIILESLLC